MPLFHEASRIYSQVEVDFMRSCYTLAAILLEESEHEYSGRDLASSILLFYDSGLRDQNYIVELSARLSHKKYADRHQPNTGVANSNARQGVIADDT